MVLDDDPTGTQTVHNVCVLAEWSVDVLAKEVQTCFFLGRGEVYSSLLQYTTARYDMIAVPHYRYGRPIIICGVSRSLYRRGMLGSPARTQTVWCTSVNSDHDYGVHKRLVSDRARIDVSHILRKRGHHL